MTTTLALVSICLAASTHAAHPAKKPAPPAPPAKDACAFWEARGGKTTWEDPDTKAVRVYYAGLAPPAKCEQYPADVMATIREYGDRKLQRMQARGEELRANLAKFGPGPYRKDTVPALDSEELAALPAKIAAYRAHGDRRDEVELCAFWYVQHHVSLDRFDDDYVAHFESFCQAPPPKDAKDACAFWDRAGVIRPRACNSYDPDVMRMAEWLSFNTNGTPAQLAVCAVHSIQDRWTSAQFYGARNKTELVNNALDGCQ